MLKDKRIFTITENDAQRRLDRVLRKLFPALPLSRIYSSLRHGFIKINGKKVKPSYITQKNDTLEIHPSFGLSDKGIPESTVKTNYSTSSSLLTHNIIKTETLSFGVKKSAVSYNDNREKKHPFPCPDVIFKTKDILFINKPQGIQVHGENSLQSAVLKYFMPLKKSLSFKPGPLHRLDKNTTGIIAFSQSLKGAHAFTQALQKGIIGKYYLGIIEGLAMPSVLKSIIDGKECTTFAKVLHVSARHMVSLVLFTLITGKKHQIRLQCGLFGTPLLNDKKYGSKQSIKNGENYFLHAFKLECKTPFLDGVPKTLTAPLPARFKRAVSGLFQQNLSPAIL